MKNTRTNVGIIFELSTPDALKIFLFKIFLERKTVE